MSGNSMKPLFTRLILWSWLLDTTGHRSARRVLDLPNDGSVLYLWGPVQAITRQV